MQEEYDKLLKKHDTLEHSRENLVKSNSETNSQLKKLEEIEQENYRLKLMLEKGNKTAKEL
jgi:cell shape-determining protein MreC